MPTYVAFLRAVNVAPRWVKMAQLTQHLEVAGFADVATHIQSGNVRLSTPMRSVAKVERAVEQVVQDAFGLHADTMVRTPAQLREVLAAAEGCPAPEGATRQYVSFCAGPVVQGAEQLDAWDVPGEWARVIGSEVHWGLTGTIHDSRLGGGRIEKLVGQPATARDLKVVRAVVAKWC